MSTPSMTACGSVSRVVPRGQMTTTWWPASTRARLSCHTRRSKGTDRFSTRISTRATPRLPGDAGVAGIALELGGPLEAHEVDQRPAVRVGEGVDDLCRRRADHERLAVGDDRLRGGCEQALQVWDAGGDVVAVRALQARQGDVAVIDEEVVPAAEQALGELHEGALAQVVRA